MAHLLFDTLSGVTVNNQTTLTVQSLLDSQNLSNENVTTATVVTSRPPTAITLDEEDVFQCGKCKKQFTSFPLFMNHKKEHAVSGQLSGSPVKHQVQGNLVALSLAGNQQETAEQGSNNYSHTIQEREGEVGQPIILGDTDILSFSIDPCALNISTGSHVLPSLSHVIQTGTFLTSPGESNSSLKSLPGVGTSNNINVTTLEPIILTEGSFVTSSEIQQQQQSSELAHDGGKIVEYGGSAETNLEFLDNSTGAVEFTTEDIIAHQSQPTTDNKEILLSNIVKSSNIKYSEGQRSTAKRLKQLRCKFCIKDFAKNFDLQQHMRSHTGEKPFQCIVCGRAFSQKSNVKKHMATHKVWPQGLMQTLPKDPLQPVPRKYGVPGVEEKDLSSSNSEVELMVDSAYVCQYCGRRYESYFEHKTHMKTHSHEKVYRCIQKNCHQTFSDLDAFVTHTRVHSNEVLYRCHVCNKQFHTLTDLGIHQYSHNTKTAPTKVSSRYFHCAKCKSKFSTPESRDHHMAISSHNYPCQHCGKTFACERYLRRHLPTHGTAQSFKCNDCGKGFRTEQYLKTHKLTHSTDKPHVCEHCNAAFNRKDKLMRHMLIHQSVKKFKCPFRSYLGCLREFNRKDKLKLHILTHSSVRPSLQCRICNKVFQRQTQLRHHERTHHQMQPHVCQNCGMGFSKKISLAAHECDPTQDQIIKRDASQVAGPHRTLIQNQIQQLTRRGIRRTKLRGHNKLDLQEMGQSNSDSKTGDNVPTINIIVMPVPVTVDKHSSVERNTNISVGQSEGKDMYRVVFPAESKVQTIYSARNEEIVKHCTQQQDQEVPVSSNNI